jgi:DNA (cytosine-5)-methyltransferase 1
MKLATFFAGAGGLDLGFSKAGFDCVWANEYDKEIWQTYEKNHPHTFLDKRSITEIDANDVPDCDGIIGGPPCQSWSEAGAMRGIKDKRGQLFYDFIRILEAKQPKFFLAENVSGMLHERHRQARENIMSLFSDAGYDVYFQMLNAVDYGVPQDRKRVFFVGFRKDLNVNFQFPETVTENKHITLEQAIRDLGEAVPVGFNSANQNLSIPNHEYMTGGFSSIYMSRNRVRSWDEPSFTIQAGGRHAPIHPNAPKMQFVEQNVRIFVPGKEHLYRRLSVRECARVQTFPDSFVFHYDKVTAGYKMVGNAVPVRLAKFLAKAIKETLEVYFSEISVTSDMLYIIKEDHLSHTANKAA